jgi:hypothetical protein
MLFMERRSVSAMTDSFTDRRGNASPVCYADDVPEAEGPLSAPALARHLNELVEGERAGARGLLAMRDAEDHVAVAALLDSVARDEARFCALLVRHVRRLGGNPSQVTGAFHVKLLAQPTLSAQLSLLDRGQKAVVRTLDWLLPRVDDAELRRDLDDMRQVHLDNIARCARQLNGDDAPAPHGTNAR